MTYDCHTIAIRLLWVVDNAPFNLGISLKFTNGTSRGFLSWVQSPGVKRFASWWDADSMLLALGRLTADVLDVVYSGTVFYDKEDANTVGDGMVYDVVWVGGDSDRHQYIVFQKETQYKHWAKKHLDWARITKAS